MLLLAVSAVCPLVLVVLFSANRVGGLIGYHGQRILLRFMGLILPGGGTEVLVGGITRAATKGPVAGAHLDPTR
jgi:small neutral amino acid transporter SnatA (MarC family)